MGLDNSIVLRVNIFNKNIKIPKCFVHEVWYEQGDYMVCYWRKCWGIRNKIITDVLKKEKYPDECVFILTSNDITNIIKILKYYDNEKNWDMENSTIWWYKEDKIHKQIKQQIKCLKKLYVFLKKQPTEDVVCYFYDSY